MVAGYLSLSEGRIIENASFYKGMVMEPPAKLHVTLRFL